MSLSGRIQAFKNDRLRQGCRAAGSDKMTSTPYSAKFFFHGQPVGLFRGAALPQMTGVFEYEPFRGLGHLEMWQEIEKTGFARCDFEVNGAVCSFEVRDAGEYGSLALSHFAA